MAILSKSSNFDSLNGISVLNDIGSVVKLG
jgi:hypothetical protein